MESSDTNKGSRTRSDENHIQQHNMFETEHSESVSYRVDNGDPAINSDTPSWPNFERFPYNRSKKHGGLKQASELVAKDLRKANNILIITGFTSMSYLISFFSECWERGDCKESLRLVIGYDYVFRKQKTSSIGRNIRIGEEAADEAIRSHLLRQRYSVYQCLQVVNTKHLLAMDHVQVRTSPDSKHHVHAKIYKTDEIITFGSSNFSPQGLGELIEVNARTKRPDARFVDISRYAEQIWQICRDYKKTLQDLLDKLMREVTWQEALARSCAELLEGAWAKRYIEDSLRGDSLSLWPFQIQGIAEALYIIENIGGVLVADATGSGKTRLGSMLIKSLTHKMLSDPAQMRNMTPVLLSPPKVYGRWKRTIGDCGFGVSIFSHGAMSNPQSKEHKGLIRALRRAQVIVVDEAHNFLNRNSQRSQVLMHNFADHILLFTATPINRDPGDLFRIVTLLGPDNFDDALVNSLVSILGSRRRKRAVKNQDLATGKRDILQDVVRQFTLRRTKKIINQIVESDQDNHLDDSGRICRYPEHLPKTYSCLGTQQDQEIAHKIYQESQQLKGLIWLRTTLQQPPYSDKTDQQYLDQRLRGAQGLASYMIMNALRSSRAALIEHIFGTIRVYLD